MTRAAWPLPLDDPYPAYRRLQRDEPVHWLDEVGAHLVLAHDDVLAVLHDDRWSSDPRTNPELAARFGLAGTGDTALASSLLFSDPPEHTRLRTALTGYLTPRSVEQIRDRVGAICDAALAGREPGEPFDVMAELAYPVPLTVMCEILDADPDIAALLRTETPKLTAMLDPLADAAVMEAGTAAALTMMFELVPLVADRRTQPADDLLSALAADTGEVDTLAADEVIAMTMLLLAAGHETTANLVGNAVIALRAHPALLQQLRADPALIPVAVEELLRYDSPVQLAGRIAKVDVPIGDVVIEARQQVLLCLGAANRDPAAYDDPDDLRLDREGVGHLAFGHGRHFCAGASLARVEMQEILRRLINLDPGIDECELTVDRGTSPAFRQVTRLLLTAG